MESSCRLFGAVELPCYLDQLEGVGSRAVAEVSGWQRKLEASGEDDLLEVVQDLHGLRTELEKGMEWRARLDAREIGRLLGELGSKVQAVADKRGTSAGPGVEEKLKKLGGLLSNEAASISQ